MQQMQAVSVGIMPACCRSGRYHGLWCSVTSDGGPSHAAKTPISADGVAHVLPGSNTALPGIKAAVICGWLIYDDSMMFSVVSRSAIVYRA